jgi:transcriptional regulator of acetoin/glycerol metabolism
MTACSSTFLGTLGALLMATRKRQEQRKPKPGTAGPRSAGRLQRALDATATREIRAALAEAGGVVAAARLLGISKVALWKRMRALGIRAGG